MVETRACRKVKTGFVVSDKMDKSVVVSVERLFIHKKYGKAVKTTERFIAHDEKNECKEGDKVEITETRPVSKNKRWRVVKVVGHKGLKKENDTGTDKA